MDNIERAKAYLAQVSEPGEKNVWSVQTNIMICLMHILLEALSYLGRIATAKERLAEAAELSNRRIL